MGLLGKDLYPNTFSNIKKGKCELRFLFEHMAKNSFNVHKNVCRQSFSLPMDSEPLMRRNLYIKYKCNKDTSTEISFSNKRYKNCITSSTHALLLKFNVGGHFQN